jgi:hypothetical protein
MRYNELLSAAVTKVTGQSTAGRLYGSDEREWRLCADAVAPPLLASSMKTCKQRLDRGIGDPVPARVRVIGSTGACGDSDRPPLEAHYPMQQHAEDMLAGLDNIRSVIWRRDHRVVHAIGRTAPAKLALEPVTPLGTAFGAEQIAMFRARMVRPPDYASPSLAGTVPPAVIDRTIAGSPVTQTSSESCAAGCVEASERYDCLCGFYGLTSGPACRAGPPRSRSEGHARAPPDGAGAAPQTRPDAVSGLLRPCLLVADDANPQQKRRHDPVRQMSLFWTQPNGGSQTPRPHSNGCEHPRREAA